MKFRDPETGEVFENITAAVDEFCGKLDNDDLGCERCPLRMFKYNCSSEAEKYPDEIARLMGYEVIEDTPTTPDDTPTVSGNRPTEEDDMDKQEKPLSEWTLREAKRYCVAFREMVDDSGVCEETEGCVLREKGICKKANRWPHLWDLNSLTEPEIAIMRAVGAKWVSRDLKGEDMVDFWDREPMRGPNGAYIWAPEAKDSYIGEARARLLPSVRPGDCIRLEEEGT